MPLKKFLDKPFISFLFLLLLSSIISCASLNRPMSSLKSIDLQIDSKISKHRIELFVMSQCPYAVEAEKAIIPVIKDLKDSDIFIIRIDNLALRIGA